MKIATLPSADPELRVDTRPDRDWVIVAPVGELDLASVPHLATEVSEVLAAGSEALRLDLRGLSFIDSSGIHYLMSLAARREEFRLEIVPGTGAVRRAFALASVEDLLPFVSSQPGLSLLS